MSDHLLTKPVARPKHRLALIAPDGDAAGARRRSTGRWHLRRPVRRGLAVGAAFGFAAGLATGSLAQATTASAAGRAPSAKPTIILEHGAFADASSWNDVVDRLSAKGYPVIAAANPLRGVASDAAALKSVVATVKGPVVLVGHSYGGEVITNAALGAASVKALVYVAAFAPDQGESQISIATKFPGALLSPATIIGRPFTLPDGTSGVDQYIDPAAFRSVFAADQPARVAARMAATQRPLALAASLEPSGVPAWKSIPSWYLVAKQDRAISPDAERFMAKRAGSHTVSIDAAHDVMVSHPLAVTKLIEAAAATSN